jgi:hypothetical protein
MAIQNVTNVPAATVHAGYPAGVLITSMTVMAGRSYRFNRRQSFSKTIAVLSLLTVDMGFAGVVNAVARCERLRVLLLQKCRGGWL